MKYAIEKIVIMVSLWSLLVMMIASLANAYWLGYATWCKVDNLGNGICTYYSYQSCENALDGRQFVACVLNQ